MKANYHTHTTRCNHAFGSEREYIESAIDAGLTTLGFADHVPYPFKDGYRSNMRMSMEGAVGYVATLRALREEYKDRIRILIGYEAEYFPELFDEMVEKINEIGYDYLIMGQHFKHHEVYGSYNGRPPVTDEDLVDYVDECIKGLETGKFLYLAHPDLIAYKGREDFYREQMLRLCRRVKELGIPLEYNLLGLRENRHYPSDRFFKIAAEVGNSVILGVDAHDPEAFACPEVLDHAYEYLNSLGLNIVDEIL